ncbi:MAG TPA: hypothetical protein VK715_13215 [Steroidobacteraceae bacterium]|nr:hypothetical protein [Steroidobacteraceae bacterium]
MRSDHHTLPPLRLLRADSSAVFEAAPGRRHGPGVVGGDVGGGVVGEGELGDGDGLGGGDELVGGVVVGEDEPLAVGVEDGFDEGFEEGLADFEAVVPGGAGATGAVTLPPLPGCLALAGPCDDVLADAEAEPLRPVPLVCRVSLAGRVPLGAGECGKYKIAAAAMAAIPGTDTMATSRSRARAFAIFISRLTGKPSNPSGLARSTTESRHSQNSGSMATLAARRQTSGGGIASGIASAALRAASTESSELLPGRCRPVMPILILSGAC